MCASFHAETMVMSPKSASLRPGTLCVQWGDDDVMLCTPVTHVSPCHVMVAACIDRTSIGIMLIHNNTDAHINALREKRLAHDTLPREGIVALCYGGHHTFAFPDCFGICPAHVIAAELRAHNLLWASLAWAKIIHLYAL